MTGQKPQPPLKSLVWPMRLTLAGLWAERLARAFWPLWSLLLVTLAFGAAPFVTPPFRGYDPALFPVQIARPSIQPAGYAFAIWSVIYLWLIAHAAYGLWKRREDPAWDRIRPALTASIAIGAVWLNIANASPIWATVTIWLMVATALLAFLRD